MAHSIFIALKVLSVCFGVFLIVSRIFLFEKTQGLIQSRIENLWIRADDYQLTALSKHLSFMKVVSGTFSSILDRIFGPKLISLQSLIVSVCYAVVTALLIFIGLIRYSQGYWHKEFLQFTYLYVCIGTIPLFLTLYDRAKQEKYLLIWMTFSLTSAWTLVGIPTYQLWSSVRTSPVGFLHVLIIVLCLSVGIALALYALSITVIRRSLRAIRDSKSFFKAAIISMLNLLPVLGIYGLVKVLLFKLDYSNFDPSLDYKDPAVLQSVFSNWSNRVDIFLVFLLIAVFLFDLVFLASAVVFALLTVLMFIHRCFWPVLSQVLYASQRFKIFSDGKILIYIGAIFILFGLGKLSWLKALV